MMRWIFFIDDEISKHAPPEVFAGLVPLPEGLSLKVFEDPAMAFEAIHSHAGETELVVADYVLPGCDGFNFLEAVGRLNPGIKLALLTNLEPEEHLKRSNRPVRIFLKEGVDLTRSGTTLPEKLSDVIREVCGSFHGTLDGNR